MGPNHLGRIMYLSKKKKENRKHTKSRLVKLQTAEVNQKTKSSYTVSRTKKSTIRKLNRQNLSKQ